MLEQKFYPFRRLSQHFSETLGATVYTINVPMPQYESILVSVLTEDATYTLDGSAPTATHGFQMTAGADPILISLNDTITLRFLSAAGGVLQWEFGI